MAPAQRRARELLGWSESAWNGGATPCKDKTWNELPSGQQAAVRDGLGLSPQQWNSMNTCRGKVPVVRPSVAMSDERDGGFLFAQRLVRGAA